MGIAFAIDATEYDSVGARLRSGEPTVDLREYGFHVRLAVLVFRIPPIERAQRLIERIVRFLRFRNDTQRELMHEPTFRARITGRIHRFLTPLQHALRLGERAFLLRVTGGRKKEDFG